MLSVPHVLGVDSSLTNTGVYQVEIVTNALGKPMGWSASGWCIPTKPGADTGPTGTSKRIKAIVDALEPTIIEADLVVLEGQSSMLKGSSAQTLPWVWGRIVDCVAEHGVRLIVVPPTLRMKYATGKGNAQKDMVLAATLRRWPMLNVSNNDEADALNLAAIGCRDLGFPIDDVPKTHWEPVMKKVSG